MLDIVNNYKNLNKIHCEQITMYQELVTDYNILIRENTRIKQELDDLTLLLNAKIGKYKEKEK